MGVECDPAKHNLFLSVEPITGITMRAAKRLQISSTFDSRYSDFDPDVRSTVLPIFWAEEVGEISVADAQTFKDGVYAVRTFF